MTFTNRLLASALTAALLSTPALAQTSDHSGHDMSQMDHSNMQHGDMKTMNMDHGSMDHTAMMKARAAHMVEATGVVKQLNKREGVVSLSHGAIPAINWPPMTMKFPAGAGVNLDGLKKGQRVQFTLHRAADGSLPLVELCPTVSAAVIPGLCAPGMEHGSKASGHDNQPHAHGDH